MERWQDVYHKLDPREPLEINDERLERSLYVNDFFDNVKDTLLLNGGRNFKLLFSGHTGCGKSTFLNLLFDDADIQSEFHSIKYSIKDILDPNDIDHVDLLLTLLVKTVSSLPEKFLKGRKNLIEKARDFAGRLHGLIETVDEDGRSHKDQAGADVSAGLGFLDFFKSKLFLKYQYERETRTRIRKHYKSNITDFISFIDGMLRDIETALDKKLLILIDDTDKIPPENGENIFYDNGRHLASPKTNIVFVIDVSLSTSSKYAAIKSRFDGEEFFPAVKLLEQDGSYSDTTRNHTEMLEKLVLKRMPENLIDKEAMALSIRYSGGVVRELIRMLQFAIFNAKGAIKTDNVEYARYKIANEYNLYGRHTKILRKIAKDPTWLSKEDSFEDEKNEKTVLDLLHMPAMFQYRNGAMKWYKPYPIFDDWLEKLG